MLSNLNIASALQLKIQTASVLHIRHVMGVISSTAVQLFWTVQAVCVTDGSCTSQ